MTDAAEHKYGFDPSDASSFPTEPELIAEVELQQHLIEGSVIDAYYEVDTGKIRIKWTNPEDGSYSLRLKAAGSGEWNIYYGGHPRENASVDFGEFDLTGVETLAGGFTKYALDGNFVERYSEFTIDLSTVEFPDVPVVGGLSNRIGYTFSSSFPRRAEAQYREFLRRVFPILYEQLGPPAESFNLLINNEGEENGAFIAVKGGRTMITDAEFVPRLIVHELVHVWKGNYSVSSDENWEYDTALSGFEEGPAEAMAFEIIHEYVRNYPRHSASIQLLESRPDQYWGSRTVYHDSIKNVSWTGGGDFWNPNDSDFSADRYNIAATTIQIMIRENSNFMKEFLSLYYEAIRDDSSWRPNRQDIIDIWEIVVPEVNGHPLRGYLNTLPVFNGRKLDEGIYIVGLIRTYGQIGDQQFYLGYAIPNGMLWWGLTGEKLLAIPTWMPISLGDDGYTYPDTQEVDFVVEVSDAFGQEYRTYNFKTDWQRYPDGAPTRLGYFYASDLKMERFSLGLYKETITFTDYIEHDEGARDQFYFIGLKGFKQDKENDYVIMIAVDGVSEGTAQIVIDGESHTAPISNGVAVFRSREWRFDMQGRFPITITNANSVSKSYFRTLIEAASFHDFFQHQFIIVDTDFDGIEDQFDQVK